MNYITDILINNINSIKKNILPKYDEMLSIIVKDIVSIINFDDLTFKKYDELKLGDEYTEISTTEVVLTNKNTFGFQHTKFILNKMNRMKKFIITISHDIVVDIYYHNTDNMVILYKNINKIITRLWNLFIIFGSKTYQYNNKIFSPKIMNYKFYLYNNPRYAQSNGSGASYLKKLHNTKDKCFNTSSGQIIFETKTVVISRLEDCIGLLTHEFLHSCGLIVLDMVKIPHINMKFSFLESYVNAFTTIFHSYLLSKEIDNMTFANILKIELMHSIIQLIRLFKISGFTLEQIYSNNMIDWYQNAYIYEYIVGRFLILMNFKTIMSNKKFRDNILSRIEGWNNMMDDYAIEIIKQIHMKDDNILELFNHITSIYCSSVVEKNSDDNMIMQYFCYDPLIVEESKKVVLYGGNKILYNYIKYKNKYLELKKLLL